MLKYRYIKAAIVTLSMALVAAPTMILAETLSVLRGDICAAIEIPENRSLGLESAPSFVEIVTANPAIADISSISTHLVMVYGITQGRTTIALFDEVGDISGITEVIVTPESPDYISPGRIFVPNPSPVEIIEVLDNKATQVLSLPVSVSIILESDVPIIGIKKGNTDIADAAYLMNDSVYVLGKSVGTTTLTLLRDGGQPATVIHLNILPNMEGANPPTCPGAAADS